MSAIQTNTFTIIAYLMICAIVTLSSVSCKSKSTVEKANLEGILLLANSAEPEGLDPQIVTGVPENNILRALFEGLCVEDPEFDGKARPGVASSWEHNTTFTQWTFHLRPNAVWSDGTPLTSEDFLFAYQRILHPKFAAKYANMLYFILHAEAYNKGDLKDFSQVGVKAPDAHTLVITTESPVPFLPELTKHYTWFPIPKHTVLRYGKMTEKHTRWTDPGRIVSNGPFILKDWKFNYYISVKKNPNYWDHKTVQLNGIKFFPISNTYTEARMFFDQQIHGTYGLAPEMIEYSRKHYPKCLHQEPYLGTYFIRCNTSRNGLSDARVRRALAFAINQQSIIDHITKGHQLPATGFTPHIGGYSGPDVVHFNPEKARKLLADAGYPGGRGFPKLSILTADRDLSKRLSEACQDMWKKHLGIQVSIQQQEWKTHLESRAKRNYDLCISSWIGDYPDPKTFLEIWTKDGGNNRTTWFNDTYESYLKKADTCPSQELRFNTLKKAESILMQEMPILPIYWMTTNYLLHPSVKNWHPLILNNHPYKFIRLE